MSWSQIQKRLISGHSITTTQVHIGGNDDRRFPCRRFHRVRLFDWFCGNVVDMEPVKVSNSTSQWLRQLGAVRPMAPAAQEVLVLGTFKEGFYPIEWTRYRDTWTRDFNGNLMNREPTEQWRIFGFLTHEKVTREDCERILRSCN